MPVQQTPRPFRNPVGRRMLANGEAINKAQRNALKVMIPEAMRQTLIAQYKGDDVAVRRIQAGAGAEALAELPAPLTDGRAEQQKERLRALWDEIRSLAPGGVAVNLTPGYFHSMMTRSEHSHERLDEFIAYMEGKLDEAKALES